MDSMKEAMERAGMEKVEKVVRNSKLFLRIPTIKKVETTAETQEVIDRAVANARQYLASISSHMAELVSRIRRIQGASPEERALCSRELRALQDEVLAHLNCEEGLLRTAAAQAYAAAMASTLPTDKRDVMGLIQGGDHSRLLGLLELRILTPVDADKKGVKDAITVKVYGKTFLVNGKRDFAAGLAQTLSDAAACAAKAAHERYHSQVAVLKGQATISVADILAEKPGIFFLEVPDLKEGEKFFSGGALLAKSDGKKMEIVQAVGHFQKILEEIRDARIFVTVESLRSGKLPYISDKDEFRLARTLLAVLHRGIAEAQARSGSGKEVKETLPS